MGFEYLGCPYSGTPAEREDRYRQAEWACAILLKQGRWIYSPIVHCHVLAQRYDLPHEFEFWMHYDHAMLAASRGLLVLQLPGWEESRGLKSEIGYARNRNLPVIMLDPKEIFNAPDAAKRAD